jgi:hypothetical protein
LKIGLYLINLVIMCIFPTQVMIGHKRLLALPISFQIG